MPVIPHHRPWLWCLFMRKTWWFAKNLVVYSFGTGFPKVSPLGSSFRWGTGKMQEQKTVAFFFSSSSNLTKYRWPVKQVALKEFVPLNPQRPCCCVPTSHSLRGLVGIQSIQRLTKVQESVLRTAWLFLVATAPCWTEIWKAVENGTLIAISVLQTTWMLYNQDKPGILLSSLL